MFSAQDFVGEEIDAAFAKMFSPIHKVLATSRLFMEKSALEMKEEDDRKRELQEKGAAERLHSDPMSIILEAKVFLYPPPVLCQMWCTI